MHTKQKTSLFVMIVFLVSTLLSVISVQAQSVIALRVGEKLPMQTVIQLPSLNKEAEGLKVKWESTDKTVATVDYSNNIVGVKKGKTVITGKVNESVVATFDVTVNSTVTGIEMEKTALSMVTGEQQTIKAYVKPYNAYSQAIKWSTNDSKVATVSSNGTIKAVMPGTVTITAETVDGGFKGTTVVTITSPSTGIQLAHKELVLNIGDVKPVGATTVNNTIYAQKIMYELTNKEIAKVDTSGKATGLKEGVTTLNLKTVDGKHTQQMTIRVVSNIEQIFIANDKGQKMTSANLKVGQNVNLLAVGDPKNLKALNGYKVVWTSTDSKVATVDSKGVLKGLKAGKATITFTIPQETKPLKATITVNVTSTVTGVKLNKTSVQLPVGGVEPLQATVMPSTAYLKEVTWKSDDVRIATVSAKGEVKAVSVGTVKVHATTKDGQKVATATVKVVPLAKGIQVPSTSINMYMGNAHSFKASVYPDNTLVKTISHKFLTKDGSTIVKVTKNNEGVYTLTGLKPGKTQLELMTKDGGYKKVINIEVLSTNVKVDVYNKNSGTKLN